MAERVEDGAVDRAGGGRTGSGRGAHGTGRCAANPADGADRAGPGSGQPRSSAVVTGASRGIGRAIAAELARRGWAVGALARDADALARLALEQAGTVTGATAGSMTGSPAGAVTGPAGGSETGPARGTAGSPARLPHLDGQGPAGRISPVVADVTDVVAVSAGIAGLIAMHGVPDLVVANAGILAAVGPTWQVDPALWWREHEVNVLGVFNTLRAALPAMVERGSGRIVVMSSGLGRKPSPWSSAYGSSKAAVTHLVGSLAGELEGSGVAAFAISPGMVRTDMTDWPARLVAHRPDLAGLPESSFSPIGAVLDLVTDLASGRFDDLRGSFIHVRDDRAALLAAARAGRAHLPDDS